MADEDFFAKPVPEPVLPRQAGGYEPEPVKPKPEFLDVLGASFTAENEVGAMIDHVRRQKSFEPVPGYTPFEDDNLRGTRYIDEHGEAFIGARSPSEAYSIKQKIDREEESQRLRQAAGWTGTLTDLAAGLLSPTNLLPAGEIAKAARMGERALRSAVSVGGANAVGAAIQEGALHANQVTRTAGDSAVSVAGAAILGSVVGTAAGMFAPKTISRLASEMTGEIPPPGHFSLATGGRVGPRMTLAEIGNRLDVEDSNFKSGPDFYTPGANPRSGYQTALSAVDPVIREKYIAHGIDTTRGGTRIEALEGILRDKPDGLNAGPLLPTDEQKATGVLSTRTDAPYILIFDKAKPMSEGPAFVVANTRETEAVAALRDHFPDVQIGTPAEVSAAMASGAPVPRSSGGFRSVGAAAVGVDTTLKQGWGGATVSKLFAWLTPLQRMQNSEAEAARLANVKLADPGGITLKAHTAEGGNIAIVPGGNVETRVKMQQDSIMARFHEAYDQVYQDYWKAAVGTEGVSGKVGQAVNAAKRAVNAGADNAPMTPTEFANAVGIAERTDGAKSANPFIQRAAAIARDHIAEAHKIGVDAGIAEPVTKDPKFAGGYVPRIYLSKAIAAKAGEFTDLAFRSMKADQDRKALLQGQAATASGELEAATRSERKALGRRDTTQRQAADTEARIAEVGMAAKRGQSRHEAAMARVFDMNTEITDLENTLSGARESKKHSQAYLASMEKELGVLRQARDKVLRQAEKEPKVPDATLPLPKDALGPSVNPRRVVDYVTGERSEPRVPKSLGFLRWIIDEGGVKDTGGDVLSMTGGKPPKGLIREDGLSLDDLAKRYGEKIGQETYLEGQSGYRFEDEIGGYIEDAIRSGKDPEGWHETYPRELRSRMDEHSLSQQIADDMESKGMNPANRGEVIAYLRGDDPSALPGRVGGEPRMSDEEWAGLLDNPIDNFRAADENTANAQADVKGIGKDIDRLRKKINAREKVEARQMGGKDEAAVNARANRSRLDVLLDRAERIAAQDATIAKELDALAKTKEASRAKLEEIVMSWQGDTTKAAQSALARRAEYETQRQIKNAATDGGEAGFPVGRFTDEAASPDGELMTRARGEVTTGEPFVPGGKRLAMADGEVDKAVKRILRSERQKSDAELLTQAREFQNNMVSNPEGRLAYEWGETATKEARGALASRGATGDPNVKFLKERRVPIEDKDMTEFLENDIRAVVHAYTHSMVPQAEMARMFDGDVSASSAIRAIKEEYQGLIAGLPTADKDGVAIPARKLEKMRERLTNKMNDDIRDFTAMRDRILGTYAIPADPDSIFHRAGSIARQFNFLSKMGMMVPSSISEVMMPVMRHGLGNAMEAWGQGLNSFSKGADAVRVSKAQRQIMTDAGVAVEMLIGNRAMSFAEMTNDYGRRSKFERGLSAATGVYSHINLSKQWDTAMQTVAGVATLQRMMRGIESWATQGATKDAEFLAAHNIGQDQARRIWAAAQSGEGERVKGAFMPEGRTWADKEAYEMLRVGLRQAVDSIQLKPGTGMDKPLWMSTPTGAVIGQFRSFIISSQQRILVAGLQQADAAMIQGAVGSVALGTLSVVLSDLARDGALKDRSAGEWLAEGFDRSGVGGVGMEMNNTLEKLSSQTVGLRPLAGAEPASRTINQSKADVVLGPTLGFIGDMTRIPGAILSGEPQRGDVKAVFNQLPGQNHFLFRRGFNAMRDGVDSVFGIEPLPEKKH